VRGGAPPVPAPVRRSPRLQARPPPLESQARKGRGQVEPRPPPKSRPCRAGPAPSKRQTEEEEEPPEVMRPQLRPRGSPGSTPPKVLFTGVVASPGMEVALKTLGGSMATSVFDCTHLVTDRVRRTVKFLCAVARGVPIVTPEWLHEVPQGRGTGDGGLGDKERVLGDRRMVMGVLGDRTWGFWGQGEVSWGHGDSWGRGEGPWGQERAWGHGGAGVGGGAGSWGRGGIRGEGGGVGDRG
ncbi:MDC1 protein, partial [Calonectris borealis]|nr:MDC1 protein [Calonectris borealis]